jgi:hypothetical protein
MAAPRKFDGCPLVSGDEVDVLGHKAGREQRRAGVAAGVKRGYRRRVRREARLALRDER